jgi:probable phosphoglycerate mutase
VGELWLVRHGETPWSRTGQHTGRTDVPLTQRGEGQARDLRRRLDRPWTLVLTSPLVRASKTAELAGLSAVESDDLLEWDYGADEGLTTPEIRQDRPGWTVWGDGPRDGETVEEVGARVDRVIERIRAAEGVTRTVSQVVLSTLFRR